MQNSSSNHYGRAFAEFLKDNSVKYIPVNAKKKKLFAKNSIKNFDYVFYSLGNKPYIAKIKGRKFKGKTFTHMENLQNWVPESDIEGLKQWSKILGDEQTSVIVFVYCFEKTKVETDGKKIYEFENKKYAFITIKLENYCRCMKIRSKKWNTVSVPAAEFRQWAVSLEKLF